MLAPCNVPPHRKFQVELDGSEPELAAPVISGTRRLPTDVALLGEAIRICRVQYTAGHGKLPERADSRSTSIRRPGLGAAPSYSRPNTAFPESNSNPARIVAQLPFHR